MDTTTTAPPRPAPAHRQARADQGAEPPDHSGGGAARCLPSWAMARPPCATSSAPRRWPRAPSTTTSIPRKRCSRRSRTRAALRIRPRLHEERAKAHDHRGIHLTAPSAPSSNYRRRSGQLPRDPAQHRYACACAWTRRRSSPASRNCAWTSSTRLRWACSRPIDADYLMAAIVGVAFEMAERMLRREDLRHRRSGALRHHAVHGRRACPAPCAEPERNPEADPAA